MGIKGKLKDWLRTRLNRLLDEKTPVLITNNNYINAGKNTFHNGNFQIRGKGSKITIGSYCAIGKDVKIILNNHPTEFTCMQYSFYTSHFKTTPKIKEKQDVSVEIGSDVWIGDNVIILPNVNIGHGCVIGAGSVVTKSIAPYTIVGGVPAKKIKMRFNDDKIQELLKSEWWTWNTTQIKENKAFFFKNNTVSDGD